MPSRFARRSRANLSPQDATSANTKNPTNTSDNNEQTKRSCRRILCPPNREKSSSCPRWMVPRKRHRHKNRATRSFERSMSDNVPSPKPLRHRRQLRHKGSTEPEVGHRKSTKTSLEQRNASNAPTVLPSASTRGLPIAFVPCR